MYALRKRKDVSQKGESSEKKKFKGESSEKKKFKGESSEKKKFKGESSEKKKFKTDDFSLLPDLVVLNIFSFLSIEERCRAAQVCTKWYQISKSACLWKRVALQEVNASKFIRALPEFPPCVLHLKVSYSASNLVPMWLPDILVKLHEQCPSLKALILERANLVKDVCMPRDYESVMRTMLESINSSLLKKAKSKLSRKAKQTLKQEYVLSDNFENISVLLPELEVLSIRWTKFNSSFFSKMSKFILPSIKVLDMTSVFQPYAPFISLSGRVEFMEELYLSGSYLCDRDTETFLKSAVRLKVLDLEFTRIGELAVTSIKEYGRCLEKLYLANTGFDGFHLTLKETHNVLPQLHTLCVRRTQISRGEVESILCSITSLKHVDVSLTELSLSDFKNLSETMKRKLVLERDVQYYPFCDHFLTSCHYK